eukprot:5903894-Alexandrium_andersonii.AAC.1
MCIRDRLWGSSVPATRTQALAVELGAAASRCPTDDRACRSATRAPEHHQVMTAWRRAALA